MEKQQEASAVFYAAAGKITKKLEVFYNPIMKTNRDISIHLLAALKRTQLRAALPLAGSGIRAIRFAQELPKDTFLEIALNDGSAQAIEIIKKNIKANKLEQFPFKVYNTDATRFLLEQKGFDYIDIDPFGSPNPFLDAACKRIARNGILAVTATDTAPLAGAYPHACMRKYNAIPLHTEMKHEAGIRILIRKIQVVAAQYDKALTPIYCYSKDHYYRVFLKCEKGKTKVDRMLKQHNIVQNAGPMWTGALWDTRLAKQIAKAYPERFAQQIAQEAAIKTVGFYEIPALFKKFHKQAKLGSIPKQEEIIAAIKKCGCKAAPTHFEPNSIRSSILQEKLLKILAKL